MEVTICFIHVNILFLRNYLYSITSKDWLFFNISPHSERGSCKRRHAGIIAYNYEHDYMTIVDIYLSLERE